MPSTLVPYQFYGYKMVQNPSAPRLALYVGAMDAQVLSQIVSVDNAVGWDRASGLWKSGGRNRTVIDEHWQSIKDFLSSANLERILPSAVVISVDADAFEFTPFPAVQEIARTLPGIITIKGRYESRKGQKVPVQERDRTAWVLDGQHRTMAFRNLSLPEPYPINVIAIKAWKGTDYEDVMRHQTYELNMGRPLAEDFKAAVREQYDRQVGHRTYKEQIALSWIRKDLEQRGRAFSADGIVGGSKLRTPWILSMSFVEKLIRLAFDSAPFLDSTYDLKKMSKTEVTEVGKYLFDFYEGVRLSLGVLNPHTKGTIGSTPEVQSATDYWDIAEKTKFKQRLLHNVGLKAVTRGLLEEVMQGPAIPQTPQEVAKKLEHMKGIQWHDAQFQSKKDDWVQPLAEALKTMYRSTGTKNRTKQYTLILNKLDKKTGNPIDSHKIPAHGW